MASFQKIKRDWPKGCVVAASGPSLNSSVAHTVRMARWLNGWNVIAVQDSYKLMPWADALYGSDLLWWRHHGDCKGFEGEKWSTHAPMGSHIDDKSEAQEKWNVRLVYGRDSSGFSTDQGVIHYGSNSGFQAINLAILKGATEIVLVGFDMRRVEGQAHFFGDHPKGLSNCQDYSRFLPMFEGAARKLPARISIINATPDSALKSFPMMGLDEALQRNDSLHRDRAITDSAADRGCAA